jgi:hypothetical protein
LPGRHTQATPPTLFHIGFFQVRVLLTVCLG